MGTTFSFFICWVEFCLFSCHCRGVLCSNWYVRVCVSVCVSHSDCSILSDGKLRIHCTKLKHRSTEAQAGIIQMHFFVWTLVERTRCGTRVAVELIFCYQATMRTEYYNCIFMPADSMTTLNCSTVVFLEIAVRWMVSRHEQLTCIILSARFYCIWLFQRGLFW